MTGKDKVMQMLQDEDVLIDCLDKAFNCPSDTNLGLKNSCGSHDQNHSCYDCWKAALNKEVK